MTDVYPVHAREDAILELPIPYTHAGTWHAEIRARLVDENTQDWFFEVGYNTGIGENRIDTFPAEWVRRPELTDLDGFVPPSVLAGSAATRSDAALPAELAGSSSAGRSPGWDGERSPRE